MKCTNDVYFCHKSLVCCGDIRKSSQKSGLIFTEASGIHHGCELVFAIHVLEYRSKVVVSVTENMLKTQHHEEWQEKLGIKGVDSR